MMASDACVPDIGTSVDVSGDGTTDEYSATDITLCQYDVNKLRHRLTLSSDIERKACDILQMIRSLNQDETKEIPKEELFVCAVYISIIDLRMPYGPSDPQLQCGYLEQPDITVTDILQNSGVSVATLFRRMHVLRDIISLSEAVKCHLKQLEREYCIVSALYHTFERLCLDVFSDDQKEDSSSIPIPKTEGVEFRKKLCWTLFLLAKGALLVDEQIVDAFYILVCCLEYVLRTTPAFQLNSPFDHVRISLVEKTDVQKTQSVMLETLSRKFSICFEEVQSVQICRTDPFIQKLHHVEEELDLSGLTEEYNNIYKREGNINELLFLQHDPHLQPVEQNGNLSSSSYDETDGPPITPIRVALNTIQQLKNILTSSKDEPSEALVEFFENCSVNPAASVHERLQILQDIFVSNFVEMSDQNQRVVAEQRFSLAKRLYYRVMEAMLNFEKERLSTTDFSKLLNIQTFHVSLLACSIEIVLMTYGATWNRSFGTISAGESKFSFPWILDVFGLHPYDFYKVLDSFIKAEPILTPDIVKHLQSVEIRILESLAWRSDSPLFEAIAKSEISQLALPVPVTSEIPNISNPSTAELYLSPMRPPQRSSGASPSYCPSPRKSPLATTQGRELQSPDKSTPKRSQSLNIFVNKVCRLGYLRLQQLASLLDIPKDLQHKIWTCLEFCISRKPGLLKDRHLDQIMLCSLYGICKVVEKEIKFKTIVQMYRRLPHAEQHVYKSAHIDGHESDSIIGFYNRIFMHNMKTYILQFAPSKSIAPTLSPVPKTSPVPSPVYSIPNRRNFYISPMKDSPFKAPPSPSQLTPQSRQLYSFGELSGSAEKLQKINESVRARNAIRITTPRSHKRLHFDKPDQGTQNSTNLPEDCPFIAKKQKVIQKAPVISIEGGSPKKISNNNTSAAGQEILQR